jgi:hypothetical protein
VQTFHNVKGCVKTLNVVSKSKTLVVELVVELLDQLELSIYFILVNSLPRFICFNFFLDVDKQLEQRFI